MPLPIKKREMPRGDDWTLGLTVKRAGAAIDITDAVFWLTAKRNLTDSDEDAMIQVTPGDIIDAPNGKAEITIPASATSDRTKFPSTGITLYYDIQIRTAAGKKATLERGRLTVLPDVTFA